MKRSRPAKLLVFLTVVAVPATASSQQDVAVLDVALFNSHANVREPTDSAKAVLATTKLRDSLARLPGVRLVDPSRIAAAEGSASAVQAAGGQPCNVIVACAQAVGKVLGVKWVVMAKVSKTSNLIWLLSGELIDVESGHLALDDVSELKGDPDAMVPAAAGLFAVRVGKRINGQTTR
jgi:Protein of unknown function (DUF2380)